VTSYDLDNYNMNF